MDVLKLGQTLLHAIDPVLAFDQKLAYQIVHLAFIGRSGENLSMDRVVVFAQSLDIS